MINSGLVRFLNPQPAPAEITVNLRKPLIGVAEAHNPVEVPDGYIAEYVLGDPNPLLIQISGHRHVQPHQTERDELSTRLTALQAFIKSDRFSSVEIAEQGRLLRQELIMVDLLAVLNERIAAWGSV